MLAAIIFHNTPAVIVADGRVLVVTLQTYLQGILSGVFQAKLQPDRGMEAGGIGRIIGLPALFFSYFIKTGIYLGPKCQDLGVSYKVQLSVDRRGRYLAP